jgi:hypothetical protein
MILRYAVITLAMACGSRATTSLDDLRADLATTSGDLVTALTQAQGLSTDIVTLHDDIVADGLETPDSAPGFTEAQTETAEFTTLLNDATATLPLPAGFTAQPPNGSAPTPSATTQDALTTALNDTFALAQLFDAVTQATLAAEQKLLDLQKQGESMSVGDMFELQMLMNRLAQLSEMATSVTSASNSAIGTMARNVK